MTPAAAAATPEAAGAPRVSVVTPARDAEATLPATLASLRAQTLTDFEAIVVDDGSTDGTRALVEAAARGDARFRLVALPEGRGVSGARNAGLAEARGRWVLFLDADDWVEPGHLAALVAAAEADPGAAGAVGGYRYAREDGTVGRPVRPRLDRDLFLITARRCPFAIHACLVRRADVAEAGGFDLSLEVGEDWDLWQRLARAGKRFAQVPDAAGAVYRLRAGSATRASSRHVDHGLEVIGRAHGPDPRVASPLPEHAAGRPAAELARNATPFLLAHLGNRIGVAADAGEVADRLDRAELARLTPDEMVEPVASELLRAAACLPEDVPERWPGWEPGIAAAFAAVGERAGEPALPDALRLALARRFLHLLGTGRLPATLAGLHAVALHPHRAPKDVAVPDGARVLRAYVGGGGSGQAVELPVPEDGVVPAAALARALLAAQGRERARRLLKQGWRTWRAFGRLARLASRPRGRRFLRHLSTLPGGERRPALEAFVAASLPSMAPAFRPARRAAPSPSPAGGGRVGAAAISAIDAPVAERWEQVFADADPWSYDSGYEQTKYLQTLELLPPEGRPARALELACAEGHFTLRLAPRVGELLATDISSTAIGRAAERCRDVPNVRFRQLDLANDPLPGRFDLIVASEVFYYLKDRRDLARTARKIADALEPGGLFLTAHARLVVDDPTSTGFDWPEGYGADTINATFAGLRDLEMVRELRTPLYRVGLFRKRAAAAAAKPAPEIIEREATWPEHPGVAGQINRGGAVLTLRDAYDRLVTRNLPILMYHRIAADGPPALAHWRVHPERFEAQLDWLKRHGFRTVGLEAWQRSVERGFGELPGRAVCITFDDGYQDFADHAWPLLRKYGFGATVFLVSGLVGRAAEWDAAAGPPAPLMGWDEIARIARECRSQPRQFGRDNVTFGGHTRTHPGLSRVGPERLVDELRRSRAELEDGLGAEVASLAYPFGHLDNLARNAVEAAGYRLAVTSKAGRARYGDDPLRLPRINIAGEDDLDAFARKLDLREQAPLLRRLRYAEARRRGAVRPGTR